jgi:hypothetical protein
MFWPNQPQRSPICKSRNAFRRRFFGACSVRRHPRRKLRERKGARFEVRNCDRNIGCLPFSDRLLEQSEGLAGEHHRERWLAEQMYARQRARSNGSKFVRSRQPRSEQRVSMRLHEPTLCFRKLPPNLALQLLAWELAVRPHCEKAQCPTPDTALVWPRRPDLKGGLSQFRKGAGAGLNPEGVAAYSAAWCLIVVVFSHLLLVSHRL